MAMNPSIPIPGAGTKTTVAGRLAYNGNSAADNTMFSFRDQRAFPTQRRGVTLTVSATQNSIKLNTGSAVGLHVPVTQAALANGLVDPSQPGFAQKGSNVPTFITVAFTFNATSATALTISWPATSLRRANRSITTSSDTAIPAGSISITGLTASTTYWYYPYWSESAHTLGWAGAGNPTSAGSPAIAQTAQSDAVLQAQSYQGFVPLNTLQFTQPASGTSTATGGYASGNLNITGGGRSYKIF